MKAVYAMRGIGLGVAVLGPLIGTARQSEAGRIIWGRDRNPHNNVHSAAEDHVLDRANGPDRLRDLE
jgi:hypothetical protein